MKQTKEMKDGEERIQSALRTRVPIYDGDRKIFIDDNYMPIGMEIVTEDGFVYTKKGLGDWSKAEATEEQKRLMDGTA